jgi:glutamate-1-semialdehyde aminotransferase/acyl carrier protein
MTITDTNRGNERQHQVEILTQLKLAFAPLYGIDIETIDDDKSLVEMGADSLFFLRFSQLIQKRFGVSIPHRLMYGDIQTLNAVARYIGEHLPVGEELSQTLSDESHEGTLISDFSAKPFTKSLPVRSNNGKSESYSLALNEVSQKLEGIAAAAPPEAEGEGDWQKGLAGGIQQILTRQLDVLSQQLKVISASSTYIRRDSIHRRGYEPVAYDSDLEGKRSEPVPESSASAGRAARPERGKVDPDRPTPYASGRFNGRMPEGLSENQTALLAGFIRDLAAKTMTSRQVAQSSRAALADNRSASGFRQLWKDVQYPIIAQRAEGSKVWDADGNQYIDITMGFGALLFGHSPSFIIEAMKRQIEGGLQLGFESHLAGESAAIIRELTGMERSTFCNSGTEAVMNALRLARAVTGRKKVAIFNGCYHGTFDGVMAMPYLSESGGITPIPAARGVLPAMVEDIVLLNLNDPWSIEKIGDVGAELAAVLVEPLPSRYPALDTKPFLQALREVTNDVGAALIFDEVITGFRFHPGGMQSLFGIRADLATYGKAIGGGVPVAAIAGSSTYMDAIDGGVWNYGDDTFPTKEMTYFAGTYYKHPLIMAPVHACLRHIKSNGPVLQERLNAITSGLVNRLRQFFEEERVPIKVVNFGSLFRFIHEKSIRLGDLFFFQLLEKGMYVSETRNCFLSTAHKEEDIERIVDGVKHSVMGLREIGVLPERKSFFTNTIDSETPSPACGQRAESAKRESCDSNFTSKHQKAVPTREAQKGLWAIAQIEKDGLSAYNEVVGLELRGHLELAALKKAFQTVVQRHDALRSTFSENGDLLFVSPSIDINISVDDLRESAFELDGPEVAELLKRESTQPFDLLRGPLLRARLFRFEDELHVFILTIHHLITGGPSNAILIQELGRIYSAICLNTNIQLPEPGQFSDYLAWEAAQLGGPDFAKAETYWTRAFAEQPEPLRLPTDFPRPVYQTYAGEYRQVKLMDDLYATLRGWAAENGATPFIALLATFETLLASVTGQKDIVVGVHSAGHWAMGETYMMGFCINMLTLRSQITGNPAFKDFLNVTKKNLLEAQNHQIYPYRRLMKQLNLIGDSKRPPLVSVVFNLDRGETRLDFHGLEARELHNQINFARFDMFWNLIDTGKELIIGCTYNRDLFREATIQNWMELFEYLLKTIFDESSTSLDDLCLAARERLRQLQASRQAQLMKERESIFKTIKPRITSGEQERG